MSVVVATHGHCFDGLASATIFTWLLKELEPQCGAFTYRACGYGNGQNVGSACHFTGTHNAILDYRFTPADQLNWFFDHHLTAFTDEKDRAYFETHKKDRNFFFDPTYSSCAKYIYKIAQEQFGVNNPALEELVTWADVVDSAGFASAEAAIDRSEPVMRLVSVVEQQGGDAFISRTVGKLLEQPLTQVASSHEVNKHFKGIGQRQQRYAEAVKLAAEERGRVILVDLSRQPLDLVGKFVTYALFPQSVYSVVLAKLRRGYKISVGYNPWCDQSLDTDISAICARYGGGGHKVVGGISLSEERGDEARAIAESIAQELSATGEP